MKVRLPAVAGFFYPAEPTELSAMIRNMLAGVKEVGPAPKALIAPHAGYIYSGPVAATGYACLKPVKDMIKRVVLLGPSHRVGFHGLSAPTVDFFDTPLGRIKIDYESLACLKDKPQVIFSDKPHTNEHSLEVHLPFLQEILTDFTLVPLAVGEASPEEVAEVLDALWNGAQTLVVISSDLSHYYPYEKSKKLDAETCRAIESLAPEKLSDESACGRYPVSGLLRVAKLKNLKVTTLDMRNSGDTAGSREQVVGYGTWAFYEAG